MCYGAHYFLFKDFCYITNCGMLHVLLLRKQMKKGSLLLFSLEINKIHGNLKLLPSTDQKENEQ